MKTIGESSAGARYVDRPPFADPIRREPQPRSDLLLIAEVRDVVGLCLNRASQARAKGVVTVRTGTRPYHMYPLLGIVLLGIAIAALTYRIKHPLSKK